MKFFLVLLFSVFNFVGALAQCPNEIILQAQVAIDEFSINYPNCHSFKRVEIRGSNITSLVGLEGITSVLEELVIDSTSLTTTEGLHIVLTTENRLKVRYNSLLKDLKDLIIEDGLFSITLDANPKLIDISSLLQVEKVVSKLLINAIGVTDLSGLANLESAKNIELSYNDFLVDINTLDKLNSVDNFILLNNLLVASALPLSGVKTLENLKIRSYNFSNLEGVGQLRRIDILDIQFMPLATLSAFNLDTCYYLELGYLGLEHLQGFENIKQFKRVTIRNNYNLTDLSALENLESVEEYFMLINNEKLASCEIICPAILNTPTLILSNNAVNCNQSYDLKCLNELSGILFYDKNKNKIKDDDEVGIPNIFGFKNEYSFWSISDKYGRFKIQDEPEKPFIVEPQIDTNDWIYTTDSQSFTISHDSLNSTTELFFGLVPKVEKHDLKVYYLPSKELTEIILIRNKGSFTESGQVVLEYDPYLEYQYSSLVPTEIDNRKIIWSFTALKPYQTIEIPIGLKLNTFEDQTIHCSVYRDDGSSSIFSSEFSYEKKNNSVNNLCNQFVIPQGTFDEHFTQNDTTLTYVINIPNYFALQGAPLLITEQISHQLDLSTFEIIHLAPPLPISIKLDNNAIRVSFNQYITVTGRPDFAFQIRPKPNLSDTVIVRATATINTVFFPCVSSVFNTLVANPKKPIEKLPIDDNRLVIAPNPASGFISVITAPLNHAYQDLLIYDMLGRRVKDFVQINLDESKEYYIGDLPIGLYYVVLNGTNKDTFKEFKSTKLFIYR